MNPVYFQATWCLKWKDLDEGTYFLDPIYHPTLISNITGQQNPLFHPASLEHFQMITI